jgi:hypothetical protein
MKAVGLAALFAAGVLLAGALVAHGQVTETTTETTTSTVHETTTAPGTTVVTTTTVPQTTSSPTTTSSPSSSSSTPTWVWVVLAILGAAVVGLAVALLTRRGAGGLPAAERHRRLDGAVASWAAQGWALESETTDSAILRRGGERMLISVDAAGQVTARPLATP